MTDEWILNVLSDLQHFARENALPALADHLDDARVIALTEIAQREHRMPPATVIPLRGAAL